jgi:hypothetical protein
MIVITDKQIEKAIVKIEKMTEAKYEKFFEEFGEKQPHLFGYILAYSDQIQSDAARDEFIYIISVIWECYNGLKLGLDAVEKRDITRSEKTQLKEWEKLNSITDPKEEAKFVIKFITQPALWSFMTETAIPDPKKPTKTNFKDDEDFAILYSTTKLICSLLDEKVKKAELKN